MALWAPGGPRRAGFVVTKKILVIEDDSSVAGLLEDVLSQEGFEVLVERDGEWGLRTFEERGADVVLLDILLPKVQGFDLIPRLRMLPQGKDVPLLVMSGVFRRATYQEQLARRHGVLAYLDKPLDTDVLCAELRTILGDGYPTPARPVKRAASAHAPRADAPVDVPTKGDIEDLPFARLLGQCFRARVTGALMLRRESVKKIVYFKEGVPVFVRSNLLDECLGRIMVEERLITQKECERSLELKRKASGKRQGEILVEMGSISQHNLQFALELQMQEKLFEVFSWLDGTFQLNPQADYTGPQVALSMGPAALIHEGATRAMSTERIRRDMVHVAGRPLLPSTDPTFRYQAQQLDADADLVLDLVDGTRAAEAVLEDSEMGTHDAALLLYALLCAGLLRAPGPPPRMPEPVEDGDLEVLRTDEVDAVEALAQVDPALAAAHPGADPEEAGKARARALVEATRAGASAESGAFSALLADRSTSRVEAAQVVDAEAAARPPEDAPEPAPTGPSEIDDRSISGLAAAEEAEDATVATSLPPAQLAAPTEPTAVPDEDSPDRSTSEPGPPPPPPDSNAEMTAADADVEITDDEIEAEAEDATLATGLPGPTTNDLVLGPEPDAGEGAAADAAPPETAGAPSEARPADDDVEPAGDGAPDAEVLPTEAAPESGATTPPHLAGGDAPASAPRAHRDDDADPTAEATAVARAEHDDAPEAPDSPADAARADAPAERRRDDDEESEPAEADDEAAATYADAFAEAASEPPAEAPRPSMLPRASTWPKQPSASALGLGAPSEGLSEELRRQVRARLEAQAARLATQAPKKPERPKRPEKAPRPATKRGLALDLEKERVRIEAELKATIAELEGQDLYTRLELSPGADVDEVERAFERLSRRSSPERVLAGLAAPELRLLAERRLLLLRRAHATLVDPTTRRRYHTRLGLERLPEDAPLVAADDAFARGRAAAAAEDWPAARAAFEEATQKDPEEGAYVSNLAWATYACAPEDEEARERALDLLRRAAELDPRHEEVYLYVARIQRQVGRPEAATQAYQRALRCNPDCLEALVALRELRPEEPKKGGLLSRFSAR